MLGIKKKKRKGQIEAARDIPLLSLQPITLASIGLLFSLDGLMKRAIGNFVVQMAQATGLDGVFGMSAT